MFVWQKFVQYLNIVLTFKPKFLVLKLWTKNFFGSKLVLDPTLFLSKIFQPHIFFFFALSLTQIDLLNWMPGQMAQWQMYPDLYFVSKVSVLNFRPIIYFFFEDFGGGLFFLFFLFFFLFFLFFLWQG